MFRVGDTTGIPGVYVQAGRRWVYALETTVRFLRERKVAR